MHSTVTFGGMSKNNSYSLAGRIDILQTCFDGKLDVARAGRIVRMVGGLVWVGLARLGLGRLAPPLNPDPIWVTPPPPPTQPDHI